jgi:hypothetical protein
MKEEVGDVDLPDWPAMNSSKSQY